MEKANTKRIQLNHLEIIKFLLNYDHPFSRAG